MSSVAEFSPIIKVQAPNAYTTPIISLAPNTFVVASAIAANDGVERAGQAIAFEFGNEVRGDVRYWKRIDLVFTNTAFWNRRKDERLCGTERFVVQGSVKAAHPSENDWPQLKRGANAERTVWERSRGETGLSPTFSNRATVEISDQLCDDFVVG